MLFFDYEKIYLLAKGKPRGIIDYLNRLKSDPATYVLIKGNSFILNESTILDNPYKLPSQSLAEYLGILSIRSYQNYLLTTESSLDIEQLYPWIPKVVIETNPLIAIKQSKLIFNEEIKHG